MLRIYIFSFFLETKLSKTKRLTMHSGFVCLFLFCCWFLLQNVYIYMSFCFCFLRGGGGLETEVEEYT